MSAQEELEKLEREMRGWFAGCFPYCESLLKYCDRLATIREGLGKAQGEVVARVVFDTRYEGGKLISKSRPQVWAFCDEQLLMELEPNTPLYAAAHPADSAQVLVEAGTNVLTGGNHIASLLIRRMGGGDWPKDGNEVIEKYGVETYDIWCCWKSIMEFRGALAASKSEVKG